MIEIMIDANGVFTLPLYADTYQLEIRVDNSAYPGSFAPAPQEITLAEGETRNLGDIPLQGPQLTGRVVRPDGTTYLSPRLYIYSVHVPNDATDEDEIDCAQNITTLSYHSVYTDEGFTIGSLPLGQYCLQVAPSSTGWPKSMCKYALCFYNKIFLKP